MQKRLSLNFHIIDSNYIRYALELYKVEETEAAKHNITN